MLKVSNMKKIILTPVLFLIITVNCYAQLVDGYTDKLSYRSGETVIFYTRSVPNATTTSFELFDLGGNSLSPQVFISGFDPTEQANNLPTSTSYVDGYPYTPTLTCSTCIDSIPSGFYMVDKKVPIIIKGSTSADIVVVCPTNTVNAYTGSPFSYPQGSLYDFNTTVSFLRPQVVSNLFCEDFLDWIRDWAANHSPVYHLNFISDTDMDDWNEIKDAKMLIIPGHSEYWTRQARLNFDRFVDGDIATNTPGKNALILSGNTMWCQVRYESPNQFYTSNQSKLTCYRGANWCDPNNLVHCASPDGTPDPLWGTYAWMSTDLKYSVLGSIGCDWLRGGQDNFVFTGGSYYIGAQKILIPNSPILNTVTLPTLSITGNPNYIPIPTHTPSTYEPEWDGTLVKCDADGNATDVNGQTISYPPTTSSPDPVLDISALGFYQAEMIGYQCVTPDPSTQFYDPNPNNHQVHYCPFLVFKKTYTSGTVVNVSNITWCVDDDGDWSGNHYRRDITANIITRTINGQTLFYNSDPGFIEVNPAYTSVCYSACTDGSISFTPHGIYLNNAYKVDTGFVSNPNHDYQSVAYQTRYIDDTYNSSTNTYHHLNAAYIDPYCTNYQALRVVHQGGDTKPTTSTKPLTIVSLFPNPTSGAFTIHINDGNNGNYSLMVTDIYGRVIEQRNNLVNGNNLVDHSELSAGLYLWQVYSGNTIIGKGKVSIVKQN